MVQEMLLFNISFWQRRLMLALMKSKRFTVIHNQHCHFCNMFRLRSFYRETIDEGGNEVPCKICDYICPYLALFYPLNLLSSHSYFVPYLLSSSLVSLRAIKFLNGSTHTQKQIFLFFYAMKTFKTSKFSDHLRKFYYALKDN
jgi:hypothetical protein